MMQKPTRRNRPYAARMTPDQRRAQLLDVVLDIINTDGVGAVSVDGVARRAGVTRPVVYALFSDADDLLRGSLAREEERALGQIDDAVRSLATDDLVASFTRICDAYLAAVADAPERWRAIHMIADSRTPALDMRVERARSVLVGRFEEALRDSHVLAPDTDVELLACHILGAIWDSGRLLLTGPGEFPHSRLLAGLRLLITALVGESSALRAGESSALRN